MDLSTKKRLRNVLSKVKKIYSSKKSLKNKKELIEEKKQEIPENQYNFDRIARPEDSFDLDVLDVESEEKRFSLPDELNKPELVKSEIRAQIRNINETYPVVFSYQNNQKIPIAKANIFYDPNINSIRYNLIEPHLTKEEEEKVFKTLEKLKDRLDVNLADLKNKKEVYDYLNSKIEDIWKVLEIKATLEQKIKMKYYLFRNTIGLDKINALMEDPNIEDISCDGVGLPVYIFHRNPMYGEIPTNIIFNEKDALDSFVMKLAQKCHRTISVASPLMDGSLEDGSRVQITYGTDIARRGSNFTIRKFFKIPLTPVDLINLNTIDPMMLAYLWLAIENQKSILIAGSTATGKTTLLNSLSLFIEPNQKIVSIEDTAELRLPHINWMPQVARTGFGPKKYGEISLYDLLKAALRQRPDYLIVGEVRGKEASVLFQAMATGHPGLSTLHADSINAVIDRLTTRPINLPAAILQNLDIIIFITRVKKDNKITRRVEKIIEVENYDFSKNKLNVNEVFVWIPAKDKFMSKESSILKQIAEINGWSEQQVNNEILRRMHILIWMLKKKIYHFEDVSRVIKMYYTNPEKLYGIMNNG